MWHLQNTKQNSNKIQKPWAKEIMMEGEEEDKEEEEGLICWETKC